MMNNPLPAERVTPGRPLRTAAVVSRQPLHRGMEGVLRAGGYALVLIPSLAHAYVQIKRVAPDLIILNLSRDDDAAGCQLLSMLGLDSDTSRVPLLTHLSMAADYLVEDASNPDIHADVQFVH